MNLKISPIRVLAVLATTTLSFFGRLQAADTPKTNNLPASVQPLHAPGIHNLFGLSPNLFSGSAPEGDAGFESLKRLGVKTIITVDGSKPDVELAHKHGLRYIHLPHGYDGIDTNTQALLIKAAETAEGPIFLHCHHGLHRGPAAASVICMAENNWTPAQAEAWLATAGTATNYVGLYDVPRHFQRPSAATLKALPSTFPETSKVSGLTDTMVDVDTRWDNLKAIRAAGYKTPKENPDLVPTNEAVLLWEHFREAQRLPESERHGPKFIEGLASAEENTKEAEALLKEFAASPTLENQARLDKSFDAIAKNCSSCHKDYRNPSGINFRR